MRATAHNRAGELALAIYAEALEAVRADRLVEAAIRIEPGAAFFQGQPVSLVGIDRIRLLAIGKAAPAMARGAVEALGGLVTDGLVVTKHGYGEPVEGVETLEAGHPVPDEDSLAAGMRVLEFARSCGERDLVVALLSGGASALVEAPLGDLTLGDLQETNETLLASGAEIGAMNAIRSRLSRIKGGGLARALRDAQVVTFVLSDVVGNDLATIGSGPFFPPRAAPMLETLVDRLPPAVRQELLAAELFPTETPRVPHFVVGSVSVALHAALDAARRQGLDALGFQDPMRGEAREMARKIVALGKRHRDARPTDAFCLAFGGETTVTLRKAGRGGRCQEMALAAASPMAHVPDAAFLAAGTDGTDGPTDAAGGLVDSLSLERARAAGLDARKALVAHESYHFLEACDGLIFTGPTGSNVNDLALLVHLPA